MESSCSCCLTKYALEVNLAKLHHYLASQSNDLFRLLSVLAIPRIILPRKYCTETTDILQSKKCLAEGSPALLSFYDIVNKKKLEHSPICPGKSDSWLIPTTILQYLAIQSSLSKTADEVLNTVCKYNFFNHCLEHWNIYKL